jgi:hypothetical protein
LRISKVGKVWVIGRVINFDLNKKITQQLGRFSTGIHEQIILKKEILALAISSKSVFCDGILWGLLRTPLKNFPIKLLNVPQLPSGVFYGHPENFDWLITLKTNYSM